MKLSANEKGVLERLIENGRAPCTEIARELGITSQAVGKIKEKLERSGVIKGYTARIDGRKLGVEVYAVAFFHFKSGEWSRAEEEDLMKRVRGPHLIGVYRMTEGDYTHMVVYGFRSIRELEHYFHLLQKQRGQVSEMRRFQVLSAGNVFKDSSEDLLLKVVRELGDERLAEPEALEPVPDAAQAGFFS